MIVVGKIKICEVGDVVVIFGNILYLVEVFMDCYLIDVFYLVWEDYKQVWVGVVLFFF